MVSIFSDEKLILLILLDFHAAAEQIYRTSGKLPDAMFVCDVVRVS